jgi:hypothetical protein
MTTEFWLGLQQDIELWDACLANFACEIPRGLRNSSTSISPGVVGRRCVGNGIFGTIISSGGCAKLAADYFAIAAARHSERSRGTAT